MAANDLNAGISAGHPTQPTTQGDPLEVSLGVLTTLYDSAGDWSSTAYTTRSALNPHEAGSLLEVAELYLLTCC